METIHFHFQVPGWYRVMCCGQGAQEPMSGLQIKEMYTHGHEQGRLVILFVCLC